MRTETIFIKKLIKKKIEVEKEMYLTFLDLRATFDSIQRNTIWICLRQLKILRHIIQLVENIFGNVGRHTQ